MIRRIVEFKLNGKIKITLGVGIGFRLTGPAPALLTHVCLRSVLIHHEINGVGLN